MYSKEEIEKFIKDIESMDVEADWRSHPILLVFYPKALTANKDDLIKAVRDNY